MKPIIGITADIERAKSPAHRKHEYYSIKKNLADAVITAGGIPVILPNFSKQPLAKEIVRRIDGLIISGGYFDISPKLYGETARRVSGKVKTDRTDSELNILKASLKAGIPILGICGGEQLINVHFGGTLYQDILSDIPKSKNHEQKTHFSKASHRVIIAKGSKLIKIVKKNSFKVNSTHHQSVKDMGKNLIASATSTDGVIEAIEKPGEQFVLGVQWHPEFLIKNNEQLNIFKALTKASNLHGKNR